ncbi:MAG: armadillo-type protein [Piptocephalis tieghemiana]|nr:MAG: armadillo-type protein [Piptocephalis tieghemiana]
MDPKLAHLSYEEALERVSKDLTALSTGQGDPATHHLALLYLVQGRSWSEKEAKGLQGCVSALVDTWGASGRMAQRRQALRALKAWLLVAPRPWSEALVLGEGQGRLRELCIEASNDPQENRHAFLSLLIAACSLSQAVRQRIAMDVGEFLRSDKEVLKEVRDKALASIVLLKLADIPVEEGGIKGAEEGEEDGWVDRIMDGFMEVKAPGPDSLPEYVDLVEGLAIATLRPRHRARCMERGEVLDRLSLLSTTAARTMSKDSPGSVEGEGGGGLLFGLASIWAMLMAYDKPKTRKELELQRLQAMADTSAASSSGKRSRPIEEPMDPTLVRARIKILVEQGAIEPIILLGLSGLRSTGRAGRVGFVCAEALGSILLEPSFRGRVAAAGGARLLLGLSVGPSPSSSSSPPAHPGQGGGDEEVEGRKVAAEGLARLLISLDPTLVLPGELLTMSVPPLLSLCWTTEPGRRQYEGLMALTNVCVSSVGLERFVKEGGLSRIESLMLEWEDEPRIRRAATECLCNVMMSPEVVKAYEGGTGSLERLRLLGAMADQEDLSTRSAATGALAILVDQSPGQAGKAMVTTEGLRIKGILVKLLSPEEPMEIRYRVIEVIKSILQGSREGARALVDAGVIPALKQCTSISGEGEAALAVKQGAMNAIQTLEMYEMMG